MWNKLINGPGNTLRAGLAADRALGASRSRVLEKAKSDEGPLLVITEGLLVYLTAKQVGGLAEQLRAEGRRTGGSRT